MKIYRGTDRLDDFDIITPSSFTSDEITQYNGCLTSVFNAEYGLGLYFYDNIELTEDYEYTACASVPDSVVFFDPCQFHSDGSGTEGEVYRALDAVGAIDNVVELARLFQSRLESSLNTEVDAVNVDGIIVVYNTNIIHWETIHANEHIQCIPNDPFRR